MSDLTAFPPMTTNPTPTAENDARCPTLCDEDCDALCHEEHEIRWRREHQPEDCPSRVIPPEQG